MAARFQPLRTSSFLNVAAAFGIPWSRRGAVGLSLQNKGGLTEVTCSCFYSQPFEVGRLPAGGSLNWTHNALCTQNYCLTGTDTLKDMEESLTFVFPFRDVSANVVRHGNTWL